MYRLITTSLLLVSSFITINLHAEEKEAPVKKAPAPKARYNGTLSKAEKEAQRLNEFGLAQIKAKNFKAAEQTFSSALSLDAKNLGVVFNLASTYLINKEEEKAIALLTQYVKTAPPDAGLQVRLGDAYFGTKSIEAAIAAYEQGYKLEPEFPDLASKLGTVYLLLNKMNEAEKYLEIALAKTPQDLKLLTNLSSVYLGSGKPDKAINTAKKALQIKAGKELYVTLATAYEMNKDYKNALISFQRARDLGDNRDEISRKIEALKKVS